MEQNKDVLQFMKSKDILDGYLKETKIKNDGLSSINLLLY